MASGIEQMINDPVFIVGAAVIILGMVAYKKFYDDTGIETMSPETMQERLHSIFVDPSLNQGAKIKDYVKMRGTSNTPRTIGLAVRAKDSTVQTMIYADDEGEKAGDKYEMEKVPGTTYRILKGSQKRSILPKYYLLKTLPGTLLYDRYLETYDAPASHITPGDDYIWFSPNTHFVKYNGIHRVLSEKGMGRQWGASFSKLHENYLEAKQAIPEQYSTLNNRLSGQIRMENIKSENIRDYMEAEEKNKKKEAMQD